MLGNQYFMAGRFEEATSCFEATLAKHPGDLRVRRQLIVCNVFSVHLDTALENLKILLEELGPQSQDWLRDPGNKLDIEIFFEWLRNSSTNRDSREYMLSAAILMLFFKPGIAWAYFLHAREIIPEMSSLIDEILNLISSQNRVRPDILDSEAGPEELNP